MERKVKEFEYMKMAQKNKVPYYSPSGIKIDVSKIDFSKGDSSMQKVKKAIQEAKSKYGIKEDK